MTKKTILNIFEPFQAPSNAGLALFPAQKNGSKMVGMGVRTKTNKLAHFAVCSPHIPKNHLPRHNSLYSLRSDIPPFLPAKVDIRGLISGARKAVIFAKKKVGFFLIL